VGTGFCQQIARKQNLQQDGIGQSNVIMLLHFWLATRPDRVGNWRLQARKR